MIISDTHKFVFVHIPKTGGTSIKKALLPYYNKGQIEFDEEKVTDLNGYRPHIAMTNKLAFKFASYFKFAIVRNPWSWHASIWRFFQRPDRFNKWITGISFHDYIEDICYRNIRSPYYKNQADWFYRDEEFLVDYVGKFENLPRDFNTIINNIGVPVMSLPHYKNSGLYDYRSMYSNPLVDTIAKKHQTDIDLFGYKFE